MILPLSPPPGDHWILEQEKGQLNLEITLVDICYLKLCLFVAITLERHMNVNKMLST